MLRCDDLGRVNKPVLAQQSLWVECVGCSKCTLYPV